jgi:hypothetical protein
MSKFTDKLTRSYRNLSSAIGFISPAQAEENRPILLIANLTNASDSVINSVLGSGVDAAVVEGNKLETADIKILINNSDGIPIGMLSRDTNVEKVNEFIEQGGDFVIFNPLTPIDIVNKEGAGKILSITPSMEPGIIRAINALDLPVDGVLIEGDGPAVTVERLLVFQFLAGLLDKPLMAMANATITSNELNGLFKAGVNGLILPRGFKVKAISELKGLIGNLPKVKKKKSSGNVLVPKIGGEAQVDADDEDDDEDY